MATVEPDDGGEVLELFRGKVVNLARHLPVDVPGIQHEHLILTLGGLRLVEMPELTRNRPRVKEVGADRDHDVHGAGLNELAAHLGFTMPGTAGLRGHDEPRAPLRPEVAVEVGDPQVVAVGDLLVLVDARQAERQAAVGLHLLRVHHVHVERRVGHDEVAGANERFPVTQLMDVLVKGVRLADVALEPMHGQVHLGQADGGGGLLLAEEGHALHRLLPPPLDKVAGLYEHAARTAGGIEDDAMVGLDDVDDGLHKRRRGEKLAVVLRPLHGELHQEILIDAPEDIAGGIA